MNLTIKNFIKIILIYLLFASANVNQIIHKHFSEVSYENQMAY